MAVMIEALGIDWLLRCKNCSVQDRLLRLRQQVAMIGVILLGKLDSGRCVGC
jgi:hypothetical protein